MTSPVKTGPDTAATYVRPSVAQEDRLSPAPNAALPEALDVEQLQAEDAFVSEGAPAPLLDDATKASPIQGWSSTIETLAEHVPDRAQGSKEQLEKLAKEISEKAALMPEDEGPWGYATRSIAANHEIQLATRQLMAVAATDSGAYIKLGRSILADLGDDALSNAGIKAKLASIGDHLWKFLSGGRAMGIPSVGTLSALPGDVAGGLSKVSKLGAGIGIMGVVTSWKKLAKCMDDPTATRFEQAARWIDLALNLASVGYLPLRGVALVSGIAISIGDAVFWNEEFAEKREEFGAQQAQAKARNRKEKQAHKEREERNALLASGADIQPAPVQPPGLVEVSDDTIPVDA